MVSIVSLEIQSDGAILKGSLACLDGFLESNLNGVTEPLLVMSKDFWVG